MPSGQSLAPSARCMTVKEVLRRRYAADYEISCTSSLARAERELSEKRAAGEQVAVVLVEQSRPETDRRPFLVAVGELHPFAKRVLLIEWGAWRDESTAAAVRAAMVEARVDSRAKPPASPCPTVLWASSWSRVRCLQ
jgi:hypothetical protein